MDLIKEIKNRYDWKGYLISCIIVSFGAFFIYALQSKKFSLSEFIIWLPISWIIVLILMIGLTEFLWFGYKGK